MPSPAVSPALSPSTRPLPSCPSTLDPVEPPSQSPILPSWESSPPSPPSLQHSEKALDSSDEEGPCSPHLILASPPTSPSPPSNAIIRSPGADEGLPQSVPRATLLQKSKTNAQLRSMVQVCGSQSISVTYVYPCLSVPASSDSWATHRKQTLNSAEFSRSLPSSKRTWE